MKHLSLSITNKILIFISVVIISTSIAIGLTSYRTSHEILEEKEMEILNREVSNMRSRLNEEINTLKNDIQFLSITPPIQGIIRAQKNNGIDPTDNSTEEEWKKRLNNIFIGMLKSKRRYSQIRLISVTDNGKEIIRTENNDGNIVKISDDELQYKNEYDYYIKTKQLYNNEVYISDVNLNREMGMIQVPHTPVIRASTPIYDYNGDLFAIIVINQRFEFTINELQKYIPKNHDLYLINQDGYYIYNKENEKRFGFDLGTKYNIRQLIPQMAKVLDNKYEAHQWDDDNHNHHDIVFSYMKLQIENHDTDRFIGVLLTQDYSNILASSDKLAKETFIISITVLIVTLIISTISAKNITSTLTVITSLVQRYGNGDNTIIHQLPIHKKDEIGILAKTFKETIYRTEENKGRLQGILENIVDGVVTSDDKGNILTFNKSAQEIFGYREKEAIGKNLKILMPQKYKEKHDQYIEDYKSTGDAKIIGIGREVEAVRKNGQIFPMELGIGEMEISGEKLFVGIIRDITERKDSDEKLKTYAEELEWKSNALEAANILAEEAKAEAERANALKSDFLANMSHEIRTPMNGIIGMTELLLETKMTKKQKMHAKTVLHCAEGLLHIINDILDFSKVEAGKLELEHIPLNLYDICNEVSELTSLRIKEKKVKFNFNYNPNNAKYVIGDPGRIRQVINNLLGNAEKFTKKGEISFDVEQIENPIAGKGRVKFKFSVTDTGIGIAEKYQSKIFEKFSQADSSTTRKFGGTGLGLAISKQLVEIMGGEIGMTSSLEEGSTFWFTVEFGKCDESKIIEIGNDNNQNLLKNKKLLLVDDNRVNIEFAKEILSSFGCTISTASNGLEAIEKYKNDNFNIILMDVQMPEMDGYEATNEIRKLEQASKSVHIPIIALTANAMKGDDLKCKNAGMDDYLSKPIKKKDLENKLNKWII